MNDELHQQLAASQAREQQLREIVMDYKWNKDEWAFISRIIEALTQPADTTALEAMITKAGEIMRERAIERTKTMIQLEVTLSCVRNEIRALPAVTIDDLK